MYTLIIFAPCSRVARMSMPRQYRKILNCIDHIFCTNNGAYTYHQDPKSLNKFHQGGSAWKILKKMPRWTMKILWIVIYLPLSLLTNVEAIILLLPPLKCRMNTHCWRRLLGTLYIIVLEITGRDVLLYHLQDTLLCFRCLPLTPVVNADLADWGRIVASFQVHPIHIIKVIPPNPNTSMEGMECFSVHMECRMSGVVKLPLNLQSVLSPGMTQGGNHNMNSIKLTVHYERFGLFALQE